MQYELVPIPEEKFNARSIAKMREYMKESSIDKLVLAMPESGLSKWITVVGMTKVDKESFDKFTVQIDCYLADDLPDLFCHSEESLPVCNYVNDIRKAVDPWSRHMLTLDRLYEIV